MSTRPRYRAGMVEISDIPRRIRLAASGRTHQFVSAHIARHVCGHEQVCAVGSPVSAASSRARRAGRCRSPAGTSDWTARPPNRRRPPALGLVGQVVVGDGQPDDPAVGPDVEGDPRGALRRLVGGVGPARHQAGRRCRSRARCRSRRRSRSRRFAGAPSGSRPASPRRWRGPSRRRSARRRSARARPCPALASM